MSTQATGDEKYERSSRPAIVNVSPMDQTDALAAALSPAIARL